MIPVDVEARIYFALAFILAAVVVFLLVVALSALRACDRADARTRQLQAVVRSLNERLAARDRALEHWKHTDRQRTGRVEPTAADTQLSQVIELPDRPNLRDDTGAIT